jgi:hypothetical protein
MAGQESTATFAFVIAGIDEYKKPTETVAIIEAKDWEKAARAAFAGARSRCHPHHDKAYGVFELKEGDAGKQVAHLIATAGLARLTMRGGSELARIAAAKVRESYIQALA